MKTPAIKSPFELGASPKNKLPTTAIILASAASLMSFSGLAATLNKSPNAVITATPLTGPAPLVTTLDATKSNDPDGKISAYSWKFGDGTTSASSVAAHTYSTSGTYKVSLKVTDNAGGTRTTQATITVAAPPPPPTATIPKGVYSAIGRNRPISASVLGNPDVVGVVVGTSWPEIEATERVFNWSYLDTQVQRASVAGKAVSLAINSGGSATPAWVMNLNVQKFSFTNQNSYQDTYGTKVTIPVFWDPVFLQKKLAFIQAAGKRYSSNAAIALVDAQCANATTIDWNVPSTAADLKTWATLGFTSDKLLQACQQIVDATQAAFPNQTVKMAIGRVGGGLDSYADPDYVAVQLLDYANTFYPGRFIAQRDNLSAATLDPLVDASLQGWQVIYDNLPNVGAQMLWAASDTTTCRMNGGISPCNAHTMLDKAVTIGINYGVQFLEIYQSDVDKPEFADVIHRAATALEGN